MSERSGSRPSGRTGWMVNRRIALTQSDLNV
jgi:hypothetical protein